MRGHVRKRGSTWSYVVDVGRDGTGRRRQRWQGGFRTRREAEEALGEFLHTLRTSAYVSPSKMTVGQYLEPYWPNAIRERVLETTWHSYVGEISRNILPHLGTIPLQRLLPGHLRMLYADLQNPKGRRKPLGSTTVHYIHGILHKALADAVRWNLVSCNVADRVDPPRRARVEMKHWTSAEVRSFLGHVREDRLYALWHLAVMTGMRRGELLGLCWADLDPDYGWIAVRRALVSVGGSMGFTDPKTVKGRRRLALDPATILVLKEHRKRQVHERLLFGPDYQDMDLIFCEPNGAPLHPNAITQRFARLVSQSGLRPIRLHDLRHTHATLALAAGVHPKVVAERLGHSTVAITLDLYSHSVPAMQPEAAATIAALVLDA